MFAAAAVACVACDLMLPEPRNLLLGAGVYLFFSLWLGVFSSRQSALLLDPIVVYQWWQAIVLGAAPLYLALAYPNGNVPFGNLLLSLNEVAAGHAIMVAGAFSFYLGMRQWQPRAAPSRTAPAPSSPRALLLAGGIGLAFLVFRDAVTLLTGSSVALLAFLPIGVLCMFALNPPARWRSPRIQLPVLLAATLCLLILAARHDSKLDIMLPCFPITWWLLRRQRRVLLAGAAATGVVLYLFVLAPLVTLARQSGIQGYEGVRILELGDQVAQSASSDPVEYMRNSVDQSMIRLSAPMAAGLVYRIANADGFLYGSQWNYILAALIPRAVWQDKPIVELGRNFTAYLGWASDADSASTSTGETEAGEMYWNFGWPGVLIGMYVLGSSLSLLWWRTAGPDPRQSLIRMTAFVSVMLTFNSAVEGAASPLFVGCIMSGLFFRALILAQDWFTERRRSRAPLRYREMSLESGS